MTNAASSISSQPSAELRIFISSTFRDLQREREHLVKKIFPEIRDLCRLRGVELTEVDLRWGIAEDESRPGRIIRTCLEEIDRCRPFFIGIVGDRFGWVPSIDVLHDDPSLVDSYPWLEPLITERRSITEIEFLYATRAGSSADSCALFFRRLSNPAVANNERAELDRMVEATERAGYRVAEYHDYESLGRMIRSELIALVERRWPIGRMPAPLVLERRKHEAFASTRRRAYIPNRRYLERFRSFLERRRSKSGGGIVIHAGSGAGKSSLLSYLAAHLAEINPAAFPITHFIGAGSSDGDQTEVIRRIMLEMRERFELAEEIPTELADMERELPAWLARARSPVVIFIDALDQLRADPRGLAWLPRFLPANITVVASTTGGESLEALRERGWEEIIVEPLDVAERRALIDRFLGAYRKRLHPELAARIAADPKCAIPLFLRTVLEELRLFGDHERLEQITANYLDASDLSTLFQRVLERMERDFGAGFVREILMLVATSRRGLTETELIEISGATRVELSEILHALDYHLFRRQGRLDFFHAWLRRAVEERYLRDDDVEQTMHARLASYFRHGVPSSRLAEELPWQLQKAGDIEGLRSVVGDIELFPFLATEEMRYELLGYWRLLKERYDIVEIYRESIERYAARQSDELKVAEAIDGVWEMLLLANYFDGVESLLDRSLAIRERLLGSGHPDTAGTLRRAGALQHHLEQFDHSELLLKRALAIYESAEGNNELSIAETKSTLADLYYDKGDFESSEELLREVVEAHTRLYGENDLKTAESLDNLGAVLFQAGDVDEAERYLEDSLRITEMVVGVRSLDTANRYNNLGAVLVARGKFDAAERRFRQAGEIYQSVFGPVSAEAGATLMNLGFVLKQQDQRDEAEACYRQSIGIYEKVLGPDHHAIAAGLVSLGTLLLDNAEYQEAEEVSRRAMEIRRRVLGEDHRETVTAALQIAVILKKSSRLEEAVEWYRRFLPLREEQLGLDHSNTLQSTQLFIEALRELGRNDEAAHYEHRT